MRIPNIQSVGIQKGEEGKNESRDNISWDNDWEPSKIDKEHQGRGREALGTLSRLNRNKCLLWHIVVQL